MVPRRAARRRVLYSPCGLACLVRAVCDGTNGRQLAQWHDVGAWRLCRCQQRNTNKEAIHGCSGASRMPGDTDFCVELMPTYGGTANGAKCAGTFWLPQRHLLDKVTGCVKFEPSSADAGKQWCGTKQWCKDKRQTKGCLNSEYSNKEWGYCGKAPAGVLPLHCSQSM